MSIISLLVERDCDLSFCKPATCPQCASNEKCTITSQSCPSTCASASCVAIPSQTSNSSGVSPGAVAGAVIGTLLALVLVAFGYWTWRRRVQAKATAQKSVEAKPDIPARADAVLSRPDPHVPVMSPGSEKSSYFRPGSGDATELGTVRVFNGHSASTIALNPSEAQPLHPDPFTDGASIMTASERSQFSNVIPIALVSPNSISPAGGENDAQKNQLDHHEDLGTSEIPPRRPYASSARSGITAKTFMTTSSTASDVLHEAPTIVTPKQGVLRQVLGVTQAQVLQVPSSAGSNGNSSMPNSPVPSTPGAPVRMSHGLKNVNSRLSKPLGPSPLAQQSFARKDIQMPQRSTSPSSVVSRSDPFTDKAEVPENSKQSTRTMGTFGGQVRSAVADGARPVSTASTLDGVSIRADISTASRVMLGMQSPPAYKTPSDSESYSRATSMQTTGHRTNYGGHLGDDDNVSRRESLLSAKTWKTSSSHADSLLSSFPFVPPSPISALPPRSPSVASPTRSPKTGTPSSGHSTFAKQQMLPPVIERTAASPPLSPTSTITPTAPSGRTASDTSDALTPIDRSTAGLSTFSNSSSGLESFPFQLSSPDSSIQRDSRASLDTLALSREVAAFPLEFDGRDSFAPSQRSGQGHD